MDHFSLTPHEITNKTVVNDYTFSSSSFAQSVCAAIFFSHSRGFFRVVDDELKERKLLVEHPNYSVQLTNTIAFWRGTWGFVVLRC